MADTDAATALARLQGPPPRCRMTRPEVPVGLDEVIARSMARRPDDRFDRAASMRAALTAVDLADVRTDTSDLSHVVSGATGVPGMPDAAVDVAYPVPAPGLPGGEFSAGTYHDGAGYDGPGFEGPGYDDPGFEGGVHDGGMHDGGRPGLATDHDGGPGGTMPPDRRGRRRADRAARKQDKKRAKLQRGERSTRSIAAALIIGGMLVAGMLILSLAATQDEFDFTATGVPIARAIVFDPQADGEENDDLAPLAVDGDTSTRWTTVTYRFAPLSNLKEGVGLILELDQSVELQQIGLLTNSRNWTVEVYVGSEFGPNDNNFDAGAYGPPAAVIQGGEGAESVGLGRAEGSAVLLWITDTGVTEQPAGDGETVEKVRFELFEVRLR